MIEDLKKEKILDGIKISEGIAMGKVCLVNQNHHSNLSVQKVPQEDIRYEQERLKTAIDVSAAQLLKIVHDVEIRVGITESKIFVAQKMILEDPSISEEMLEDIEKFGYNAEGSVIRVFDKYESRLQEVDDEYIKTRATDIGEIKRRILDALSDSSPHFQCPGGKRCQRGRNRIIVARELTPGLTIGIDAKHALGFVTEHGGKLSHAAILAKALGIPAVSGILDVKNRVLCGTDILIDGDRGRVIIWPSDESIHNYNIKPEPVRKVVLSVAPVADLKIMANINLAFSIDEAVEMMAEGVGLYRTEFEFLAKNKILSEAEQYKNYARVLQKMESKPVYFRLLDIGGDKSAGFLDLPHEANPYLGFRGSRLLLARPELLMTQARALAKASLLGPVHVLYPMIVDLTQFLKLKTLFKEALSGLEHGVIKHGVMFEIPSACLQARELLEHADFASIGSNDLIQYLFAVDRNNELVAYDYSPDRKVFWDLVRKIARVARRMGKPLSFCGEIAANFKYLPRLMNLGIDSISVSPRLISELRRKLKG